MRSVNPSDVVLSSAGRDKGRLFFVMETDGEYAMLADGKIRKRGKPKRKKLKHLELVVSGDAGFAEQLSSAADSEIRKALAIIGRCNKVVSREGMKAWQKTM